MSFAKKLPVVISADLIAEGDGQSGWNDLTKSAATVTCEHAMDVPDKILYLTKLFSIKVCDAEAIGE